LERRVVWAGNQVGRQTELVVLAPELPENLARLVTDVIDPPRVARGNQQLRAVGTHVDRIEMVGVPHLTRSRGSRDKRIAQRDMRGHAPGEDHLTGPQVHFLDLLISILPLCQTAVGGQIRLDSFRRDEIGVTL
jgi:hypothetical protein